jgi:acetyltransferase-like isoleucine patch superfamily enzyme
MGWPESTSIATHSGLRGRPGVGLSREVVERAVAGFVELCHQRAVVRPGRGAAGAIVGAYSTIGECVVLGRGALLGHHSDVGAFATLGPGANVAGNVRLGEDAFLGMGAVIRDHLTVGASATVAMGAVVVRDVPPGAEVRGVPAR